MPITLTDLDREEIFRYLGYGGAQPDPATLALAEECSRELLAAAQPRYRYAVYPIRESGRGVQVGDTPFFWEGESIREHLAGCRRAALLCATLSQPADRLIHTAGLGDMAKGLVMDVCASVAIEQVCDRAEEEIRAKLAAEEEGPLYFTFRFSPGYGDLPLTIQKEFLALLDAPRRIGLCATENQILTPRKSVTAVIGISEHPVEPRRRGCAVCPLNKTCAFRKRGDHCGNQ